MCRNCDVTYGISVSVAFERIDARVSMERGNGWRDFACISKYRCYIGSRLTVCSFRCTNRWQVQTSGSGMQTSSLHWERAALTLQWHASLARCNTKHCRRRHHSVCKTLFVLKLMWNDVFLFQLICILLISITFYTYLSNIVFLCNLAFKLKIEHRPLLCICGIGCGVWNLVVFVY